MHSYIQERTQNVFLKKWHVMTETKYKFSFLYFVGIWVIISEKPIVVPPFYYNELVFEYISRIPKYCSTASYFLLNDEQLKFLNMWLILSQFKPMAHNYKIDINFYVNFLTLPFPFLFKSTCLYFLNLFRIC